jgi:prevent-host-death family protein
MVHKLDMKQINVAEAKQRFSELLDRASRGERIAICRRSRPIAELGPVEVRPTRLRPIGLAKTSLRVPADFDAPLSEADLVAWSANS